jgi:hypothetical protein
METPSDFYLCGNVGKSQILRYQLPDIRSSGITTTFRGGLITAQHVVEGQKIPNFVVAKTLQLDLAFRADDAIDGLPLGWVDVWGLDAELATTSVEEPNVIERILGRIGITLLPTDLLPFNPYNRMQAERYIKPGVSGSPLIYDEHIIGILPARVAAPSVREELPCGMPLAVVFNGEYMKQRMEDFGLHLPDRPLLQD